MKLYINRKGKLRERPKIVHLPPPSDPNDDIVTQTRKYLQSKNEAS